MDPYTASVLVGLFTNGLYSLILSTGDKVGNLALREEDIHKSLMKNKENFAIIIEGAFLDLPPVIKQEEFCDFLNFDQTKEIIERIYSFDESYFEDPYNLETIKTGFIGHRLRNFLARELSILHQKPALNFGQYIEIDTPFKSMIRSNI